jgi:hypothetical protein
MRVGKLTRTQELEDRSKYWPNGDVKAKTVAGRALRAAAQGVENTARRMVHMPALVLAAMAGALRGGERHTKQKV